MKTSVAGPAPVGLTTIAGQPAITIQRLLGKKKFITYKTWAHTARSWRRKLGESGSGFIGVEREAWVPQAHYLLVNSKHTSRSLKCEKEKKASSPNGRLCIPTEIS